MSDTDVLVVSHPFSSTGMGEQGRSGLRALLAAGVQAGIYDVFRYAERNDLDMRAFVLPLEAHAFPPDSIRIFHVNGDEVDNVTKRLADDGHDFASGYNIIMPAWELPRYPDVWKDKLQKFDEIWAISHFVKDSIEACGLPCYHVGQAVEMDFETFLPRKFFGVRESAFLILNFFDTISMIARKNPFASVELYRRLRQARPFDDFQLVLKVRTGDRDADSMREELTDGLPREAVLLTSNFDTYTIRSLVAASDCLVSMHRSEGFGRGLAEAMLYGRLALGTGWSGNLDFMGEDSALLVDYELVPVKDGEYPQGQGQHWAEPDVDHALHLLLKALDDPAWTRQVCRRARMRALAESGNRAVGLRMLGRLQAICAERGWRLG